MSKISKSKLIFWFSLSIIAAVIFSLFGLHLAFQTTYIVQDDARQHVFWMQRFIDPELFPQDLIADYFQSIAPSGYTIVYQLFANLGINPFLLNKFLPLIIGIITTAYCFGVCLQIFPVPLAGFMATLLLNQNLWLGDDLVSGTPRAFIYPLLLAFTYYLLKRSFLPCLITIVLQSLFYPQTIFISVLILFVQLFSCQNLWLKLYHFESKYFWFLAVLVAPSFLIISYALKISDLGSVITINEAKALPELADQGRTAFFLDNAFLFWFSGERSGIFPREWQYILLFSFGCLLPILRRYPSSFPLTQKINRKIIILVQIIMASLAMFLIAHLFLFKLHLPSRYIHHSLRIVLALADSIFITTILDSVIQQSIKKISIGCPSLKFLVRRLIVLLLVTVILYPSYVARLYPHRLGYLKGKSPSLYQFFRGQPKESLIASLTKEADFIPTFSQRSVLVSEEYSIPYHKGYYSQIRQRTINMIHTQYSDDLEEVKAFIQNYGIHFWLLEEETFKPEYVENNNWLMQFQPVANNAIEIMKQGKTRAALSKLINQCNVFDNQEFKVLDTKCILEASDK